MEIPVMGLFAAVLIIIAIGLALPICVLWIECWAAIWGKSQLNSTLSNSTVSSQKIKVSILIPAHNEASEIGATVKALLPQLNRCDQLIVIADNCTDETAAIARQQGATVLERQNLQQRGKGYALDYGLHQLSADPPDVVVMVDADCRVEPGGIEKIAQQAATRQKPVQALYLMETPPTPSPKDSISALAFLVKNLVRPLGLTQLGQPCLLTGTGMAFPWGVLQTISLASGNIVEDMQLGLDLAIAGYAPYFCGAAQVTGVLPQQAEAATSQRTRWEHGHLQTLLTQVPRLVKAALSQQRGDLLALALDLSVPPLSLLVMLWLAATAIAGLFSLFTGIWMPTLLFSVEGILIITAIVIAWVNFGRDKISGKTLLSVPFYVLWKIPLYFAFVFKPQKDWVRTQRDSVQTPKP
jgi:cellulose synthase/poly-beta-1,6-N-acetylglucosamine synthase-like glycosyltransferase